MALQQNALTAHFTAATKKCSAGVCIFIFDEGHNRLVTSIPVDGKREARDFAKRMNAAPWNF